jgi:hypothetical protein
MWTRGYDVYTPTRNIVFHNYKPNPGGHDASEWFKFHGRLRKRTLRRIKSLFGLPVQADVPTDTDRANMGIYGIGKRRSLDQLNAFVGMDFASGKGNEEVRSFSVRNDDYDVYLIQKIILLIMIISNGFRV